MDVLFVGFGTDIVDKARKYLGLSEEAVVVTSDPAAAAELIRHKALKIVIFSFGLEGAYTGIDLAKLSSQNLVPFITFIYRGRKTNHIIQAREAGSLGARGIFYDYDFINKPDDLLCQEFIRLIKSAIKAQ